MPIDTVSVDAAADVEMQSDSVITSPSPGVLTYSNSTCCKSGTVGVVLLTITVALIGWFKSSS